MRLSPLAGLLLGLFALGCQGDSPTPAQIHLTALVADLHCDTALRLRRGVDLGVIGTDGHLDLPRLDSGGIDLEVFAVWLPTETPLDSCRAETDLLLDSLEAQFSRYDDRITTCRTAAEVESAVSSRCVAAFLGIENGVAIANDLANLRHFYGRGVRYMTLTHTASNDWCISSADTAPAFNGLTEFGRSVVAEMNRLGMIIDISHAHPTAVSEILRLTTDPVIASHSCVYALCSHDRNLTDDQIRAIAVNGGMIGVNFFSGYLSDRWNHVSDSLWEALQPQRDSIAQLYADNDSLHRAERWKLYGSIAAAVDSIAPVTVSTVCDHIDYIVQLVGPDYVGLGSDFDGVFAMPKGLEDCTGMPRITEELVRRGYTQENIAKILGGNFMRVFRQVCDRTAAA